ncbi:hypothetical protein SAY87_024260 [Trapa incisa]|uniref:Uncharacterized protein n=1 Tax=Trapa incisa TaxID=236973 RepID=A0AAN7GKJ6_9MYRT|nr:hypothetical protein SAY87_024260 [Trapa incisa]
MLGGVTIRVGAGYEGGPTGGNSIVEGVVDEHVVGVVYLEGKVAPGVGQAREEGDGAGGGFRRRRPVAAERGEGHALRRRMSHRRVAVLVMMILHGCCCCGGGRETDIVRNGNQGR